MQHRITATNKHSITNDQLGHHFILASQRSQQSQPLDATTILSTIPLPIVGNHPLGTHSREQQDLLDVVAVGE
jgi:hypothetical protein